VCWRVIGQGEGLKECARQQPFVLSLSKDAPSLADTVVGTSLKHSTRGFPKRRITLPARPPLPASPAWAGTSIGKENSETANVQLYRLDADSRGSPARVARHLGEDGGEVKLDHSFYLPTPRSLSD
jgi:hypothetical protein